jgi:hypothetical protein
MIILKNINMTLDKKSIKSAMKQLDDFEKILKPAMINLIERLAEKGVEIARAELIFFDDPAYMTGALSESVNYRMVGEDGLVTAGEGLDSKYGSYAMFVEYGTGIVGKENHHPEYEEAGYEYDLNNHDHGGWWYPAAWGFLEADDGQMLAWTDGMPARPFMYNTLQDLAIEAETMGGKIIAEYIADH